MGYLWLKAFHIIAMVCWFAGLFYLPRLFVYHSMAGDTVSRERFHTMERKLYRGIMTPAMLGTVVAGMAMLMKAPSLLQSGWMHIKLLMVAFLLVYHWQCGRFVARFKRGEQPHSHLWFRWFNEIPVIMLVVIVIMVIVRPLN
jgi:putative membrane protein